MKKVIVAGSFDNLRSKQVRFLQEAARLGSVHVLLWSDAAVESLEGRPPHFPEQERLYLLEAIQYVHSVSLFAGPIDRDRLPLNIVPRPDVWAVEPAGDTAGKKIYCREHAIEYHPLRAADLAGFPENDPAAYEAESPSSRKRVIVTGCYDWFHSGHVRFFEEVATLGDLYVVVGHDTNIRLLKGEGHPLLSQDERRYMIASVRFVKKALVSSGDGWLDAEPEIERIRPHIYAVNEDGDRPEKRAYCEAHGIEYRVLERLPKEGLPPRQSRDLRGF